MPKKKPESIPLPSSPPEGTVERETIVKETEGKIKKAAEEGRLSIRAADLAPKIIESLAIKFGPDQVVAKIAECMSATKTMAIGGKPFETPDYKTRLDALKLLLQYQVGMPVSRSEVVTHNVDTMQTLESKMQKSPALRRAVGRMLDRSKEEDGEILEITNEPVVDGDIEEAEEVLQERPEPKETPVESEVRKKILSKDLKVKGSLGAVEKYSR
jgi:lipoate synthase